MLKKITFTDKQDILGLASIDDKNKITAQDVNDIKNAINNNTDELDKIKVNKAGSTMTGALNFANNTWNNFGANVAIGAINVNGTLGIKGLDGPTAIQLVAQGASSNTDGVKWTCNKNGDSTISGTLHSNFNGPLTGNADTTTKLKTARTINDTSFDGTANITTTKWGTARNIYIADADNTNTGAAVSVNGGGNATLKLPATIKASLTGNADTATNATNDANGNNIINTYRRIADSYTKNEIDNKFSTLETAIDWKETVDTYNDIATKYPNPQDGWTVNTKDTDYTYRYSGNAWIPISANAIPKVTSSVDGLMTKELYDKLANIQNGSTRVLVDSSMSATSTNPVQNKVVQSALDTKLPLSGGTMSGMLQFNAGFGIQSTVADNDFWRILGGGSSNNGYLEIATADDGSEPIYLRQYTGVFSNLVRTATLLDGNGNTSFPGTVSASSFNGNANTATKATQDSAGQQINTTYIKGLSVSGRTITYTKGDGSTGTITTQDNNTTYPIGYKTIDANFASRYRTETKGNTNNGDYISTIRNDTYGVASSPQFGTGLAWGRADTHGYLYMNYGSAEAYLGAGNEDKLNWIKRIMLAGDNASTATGVQDYNSTSSIIKIGYSGASLSESEIGYIAAYKTGGQYIKDVGKDTLKSWLGVKNTSTSVTASSGSWSGSAAPYTNTISVSGVTTSNIVEVGLSSSATDDQVKACMSASIAKITQANGSITLYAYGTKPTTNIPLSVVLIN